MIDRFEKLTAGVSQIYKNIQRIKKHRMNSIGLKGTHVMCIYYLNQYPNGLTASDLCDKCREDKAGISRILSDLEHNGYIIYEQTNTLNEKKKYRARAILTEKGRESASKVNELILNATLAGGMGLTDEERKIFYRVLFKISDNLTALCAELDKE